MSDFERFLIEKVKTGEKINLAYAGGSRPGQTREVIIVSCSDSELKIVEPGIRIPKTYKIHKVLWVSEKSSEPIYNQAAEATLPQTSSTLASRGIICTSLNEYAEAIKKDLVDLGWYIHEEDERLGVSVCHKNGKPKKNPVIYLAYHIKTTESVWDKATGSFIDIPKATTGRERPWYVGGPKTKEHKSYKDLHKAVELFYKEATENAPKKANDISLKPIV